MLDPQISQLIRELPKTETHLHIEGALPFELIHKLDPDSFPKPPESWNDNFKFRDFAHFEGELLHMAGAWYNSPKRYYEAAKIVFQRLRDEQNVRYVETSFASGCIEFLQLDGEKVAEAIKQAAPEGMTVKVFMGLHHNAYTENSKDFIDACVTWSALDGIDLHGVESIEMEPWATKLWERFRGAGKFVKAHAGEFMGAEFVEWVIDNLKVKRIEHGVRSVENPDLVKRLAKEAISLDVCPISNVKLDVVESMDQHPIRSLFDAGVRCTINTDDPVSFGNQLHEEYEALARELNFSALELVEIAKNGFEIALIPEQEREVYLDELNAISKKYSL